MSRVDDKYCGITILWSWDYRFWSWFTSHGVQSGYTGGLSVSKTDNTLQIIRSPSRVFDKIYHLGPLKIRIGIK